MAIAISQFTIYDFHDVYSSPNPPENPQENQLWLNTNVNPPILMVYKNGTWIKANDYDDSIKDLNNKYINLEANAEGVNIELGKVTTELNSKVPISEFTQFKQDSEKFQFDVAKEKVPNLLTNSTGKGGNKGWHCFTESNIARSDNDVNWLLVGIQPTNFRFYNTTNLTKGAESFVFSLKPNTKYTIKGYYWCGANSKGGKLLFRELNNETYLDKYADYRYDRETQVFSDTNLSNKYIPFKITVSTTSNTKSGLYISLS